MYLKSFSTLHVYIYKYDPTHCYHDTAGVRPSVMSRGISSDGVRQQSQLVRRDGHYHAAHGVLPAAEEKPHQPLVARQEHLFVILPYFVPVEGENDRC